MQSRLPTEDDRAVVTATRQLLVKREDDVLDMRRSRRDGGDADDTTANSHARAPPLSDGEPRGSPIPVWDGPFRNGTGGDVDCLAGKSEDRWLRAGRRPPLRPPSSGNVSASAKRGENLKAPEEDGRKERRPAGLSCGPCGGTESKRASPLGSKEPPPLGAAKRGGDPPRVPPPSEPLPWSAPPGAARCHRRPRRPFRDGSAPARTSRGTPTRGLSQVHRTWD
ncbi:hypothetical protein HPB52_009732 [Rhipicephalus sanguineus]|uniref:Uncharacterized protein n=1 Tax=Rhipicephalus sanguineus TaxID=34632 RepID=A0A9D4T989_RHISA|nr:hypothetical protein HPB52_009732 [Rhipicephalus sanguineus]